MKRIHIGVKLIIVCFMLSGCGLWNKSEKELEKVGLAESEEVNGSKVIVEATLKDKKLVALKIDETGAKSFDGTLNGSKKELADSYNMRSYSDIGKEWYEQIASLENFIVENGIEGIVIDASGKATNEDLVSQCTISIEQYLKITKQAIMNAEKAK